MIEKYIDNHKQELINSIIKTVNYKSISTKTSSIEAPFGEECKNVLDYLLTLGKNMGFKTKNIDGYCGYIEFGEGKELLGIIGHLDVVPANIEDGWTSDPFQAEIRNNKIYGRGTIDDKGPVLACLYALDAISKHCKLNKRVRLILGLNEEKDWECIARYKKTEEIPTISFSPDANFPCIYAEKGIITLSLSHELKLDEGDELIELSSKDNAINVVPKTATIKIKTSNKSKYYFSDNIEIEFLPDDIVQITAAGISAHAAFPNLGDNAITRLLNYINSIYHNEFLTYLHTIGFFNIENPAYLGGESLIDESGSLTSNIGILNYENNQIIIKTNLRVPVNTSFEALEKACQKTLYNINYHFEQSNPKLYIDKNNYLVKTLTKIFNEETGLTEEPLAIGGGTYARAFPNCISYGMVMPNEEDLCHQVDENIDIDNLILATKIYAKAIIELGK